MLYEVITTTKAIEMGETEAAMSSLAIGVAALTTVLVVIIIRITSYNVCYTKLLRNGCKTGSERCVLPDDLAPVLDAVFNADLVVFASPVYYSDVSAQLKAFIDRTYSYLVPGYIAKEHPNRLPTRKALVFIP